jgi:hypothetical protein
MMRVCIVHYEHPIGGGSTGAKAEAWCLLIHADASLSLSLSLSISLSLSLSLSRRRVE